MAMLDVLIVDDEVGMLLGAERVLAGMRLADVADDAVSFAVDKASSGAEAVDLIAKKPYDLVLLDYKLPDAVGLDIMANLKGAHPDTLAIMMTAYASLDVAITATKNGAFDFLAKPFTPDELTHSVKKASGHIMLKRKAKRLEEERRKIRFQFISVLAHELKSPLSAIEGYLRIMKDKAGVGSAANCGEMLDRSIIRIDGMRKLIYDLLDMTSIESGERQRNFERVDVEAIARDVMDAQAEAAEKGGVRFKFEGCGGAVMPADRYEIEIMISNLVSNAIKYNRPGGFVDVSVGCDGSSIIISVSDGGIGISEDDLPKLFGEFARIKNDKTRNILGSGLGLSTVKKICSLYGGDVGVKSEENVGSTFRVELPITQQNKGGKNGKDTVRG